MKVQRWISAVLCAASLAGSMTIADAADYPTVETGKSEEGVSYTLHYPKVYGMLDAKIAVVNDSWSGDGQRKEVELKLPVVASGDPFVLEFTGGLTSARCPDCDKPLSMPSGSSGSSLVNGTTYNGPCIVPLIGGDVYEINAEYAAYEDTFESVSYTHLDVYKRQVYEASNDLSSFLPCFIVLCGYLIVSICAGFKLWKYQDIK